MRSHDHQPQVHDSFWYSPRAQVKAIWLSCKKNVHCDFMEQGALLHWVSQRDKTKRISKIREKTIQSKTLGSLTQRRLRRQQERHLKMLLRVFATIFQLFQVIILAKSVLTILELNWNQRFRAKKTKLNICHHMVKSSTQLQTGHFTS